MHRNLNMNVNIKIKINIDINSPGLGPGRVRPPAYDLHGGPRFRWRTLVVYESWAVPPLSPTVGPRGRKVKGKNASATFLETQLLLYNQCNIHNSGEYDWPHRTGSHHNHGFHSKENRHVYGLRFMVFALYSSALRRWVQERTRKPHNTNEI